ncbi:cell division protein SepF [Armatimonas sp.]|uniref:cell division protein SepF n=1 Tax=Armatimonas sp. TaxID=1872638 RepID=UPI00286B8915|nr:cell division protein SepF [Armatimonas sp.]
MYNAYEREDEQEEPVGSSFKDRLKTLFGLRTPANELEEEEGFDDPEPVSRRSSRLVAPTTVATAPATATMTTRNTTYRLSSVRDGSINIMPASSFADVQKAADRLKQGEPQILNLEKTPPEVAERLIDFLNGVTYALDGYVEKIAEGAYLFTPANVMIHADKPGEQPKPFFDRL